MRVQATRLRHDRPPGFLLVGPYDPHCGELTFLSPPLGVWRLAGYLEAHGFPVEVFDPNLVDAPLPRLRALLAEGPARDVIGFSTTAMTLPHDLALAHVARRTVPDATLVVGGMEATFFPDRVMGLGPYDLGVLGEGERPLVEIGRRVQARATLGDIPGTFRRRAAGGIVRRPQPALDRAELRAAIESTPYERMPYRSYWRRLEDCYRVGALPDRADREARLAEIRSVRLMTLNYCPMACTFCASTNFLTAAQGGTAPVARLDADECMAMLRRIVGAYPDVRTIIFQDDIFAFTSDRRLVPLCERIVEAKRRGDLPSTLGFISTNRIDAMTPERLAHLRRADFRVLGFGIESFALPVLTEFNKARIHRYIGPTLAEALALGITPFLDTILTSPRSRFADLAETVREAYRWTAAGCEVGTYPYVIPFAGAAMASDPALAPHTVHRQREVAGTAVSWMQAVKILPIDPDTRAAILDIEARFEGALDTLAAEVGHLPSRVRSLLWILCSIPVLAAAREPTPRADEVARALAARLPRTRPEEDLASTLIGLSEKRVGVAV